VASARLTELGVRHVLVGGLAVGGWGHPRATKDVVFLVGEESPRPKDLADVVELIRLGIERDAIRADLVARSPELVEKWDRAVAEAWRGDE